MSSRFIVATYSDAESLLRGVRRATEENFRVYDVFAPYPIHGLDHAMGVRRSRLPWVTFLVGVGALTLALTFQFYTTVLDWPLNVGGKPDNSTLAFVPICFELTVLLSGLATVAALFLRTRLYPGVVETLDALTSHDVRLGVVTNKPHEFSVSLLAFLGVASRFDVGVGGDSFAA